jgi:hypothetical protein
MNEKTPAHRLARLAARLTAASSAVDTHFSVSSGLYECDPTKRLARWPPGGDGFPPMTIPQKFAARVKEMGDMEALKYKRSKSDTEWTTCTWSQYFEQAMNVSKSIVALGVHKHESINILANNSPEWFFVAMGAFQTISSQQQNGHTSFKSCKLSF